MEKQLLPNPALKPAYDKASWLYVYRDFSGTPADRAAERIALRLGLTSYPQHLLLDPETLDRLADTGRTVESFLAAVDRVRVKPGGSEAAVKRLADADARAAARAKDLLAVAHDPFRFETCKALAKSKDGKAARPLDSLLRDAPESLNPNVLRIEAAKALAACGDAASIEALRTFAATGEYRNGLTGAAVDAITAIAARDPKAKVPAKEALCASYPAPAKDAADAAMCEALAKRVHAALAQVAGKKVAFPAKYDEAARKKLQAAW